MVFVSSVYVIHDAVCFSNIGPVGTEETTALKQASEWGMIGIQSSCPRVKDLCMKSMESDLMLLTVVHLYNSCAQYLAMNLIATVFMRALEKYSADITVLI